MRGVVGQDGRHHTARRIVARAVQGRRARKPDLYVLRAGVEALELGVEMLAAVGDERGRARLVEWVVADDPWIAAECLGHVTPYMVVLTLEVAADVVVPEVAERDPCCGRRVLARPPARRVRPGHVVRAHRPGRCAFTVECLVVDVLVHVQDREDVEAPEEVDGLLEVRHVAVEHREVELVWIGRPPRPQIAGELALALPGSQSTPRHAQADDVEAQACHERCVGRREVPGFARIRIQLEGFPCLSDRVDPVEKDDAALTVVKERSAGRPDGPAMAGAPFTLAPANAGDRKVGKPASTADAGRPTPATNGTVTTNAAATATHLAIFRRNTVGQSDRAT